MKNLKKLVAGLSVAAVAMSFGTAFAANEVSYKDGAAKLEDKTFLSDTAKEYTVIIIEKENQNETVVAQTTATGTITADKLLYINQGKKDSDFWDNMGTKTALDTSKTYILRIGSESGDIAEYELKLGSAHTRIKGDVTGTVAGDINILDVTACLQISLGIDKDTWTEDQLYAADVVGTIEGDINILDVTAILQKSIGCFDGTFKE